MGHAGAIISGGKGTAALGGVGGLILADGPSRSRVAVGGSRRNNRPLAWFHEFR
jgi:hypothetical protein